MWKVTQWTRLNWSVPARRGASDTFSPSLASLMSPSTTLCIRKLPFLSFARLPFVTSYHFLFQHLWAARVNQVTSWKRSDVLKDVTHLMSIITPCAQLHFGSNLATNSESLLFSSVFWHWWIDHKENHVRQNVEIKMCRLKFFPSYRHESRQPVQLVLCNFRSVEWTLIYPVLPNKPLFLTVRKCDVQSPFAK